MHLHRNAAVKPPRPAPKPRNGPVEHLKVRPDVWAAALRIAAKQPGCEIRIVSSLKVEIIS
jgi:hypothetical protein